VSVSIVVDSVSKEFNLYDTRTLKARAVALARRQPVQQRFHALDDITMTVEEGESVGLMGLNGSGKSTLLKLISGVLRPDTGQVLVRGSVAGLIEVSAGFTAALTGRENIYLNGAIMGMDEAEIEKKFDKIVDFAGIEKFLDTPVGRYSSGMYARLGFSIAVEAESDIFIIDEVLAVGDPPFKKKCLKRIADIRAEGRTIVFVSHNTSQVKRVCDRAVVLTNGRLTFDGTVPDAIHHLHYDDDGDDEDAEGGEI
jgi:ABC-2 type transport system ATP-binding protein